jgi:hypothetical protein
MKIFSLALLFISLSVIAKAPQYTPTNFNGSKEEVRDLFDSLWDKFKSMDNFHCYRRAHVLSNQMQVMGIDSVKVFYFRGSKETLPMNWYYHVAPAVYYKNEIVVMDKALIGGATHLQDWLDALSEKSQCVEFESYSEFLKVKNQVECGYIVSSMFNYGPRDLDESKLNFDPSEMYDAMKAIPTFKRKKYERLYNQP